MSVKLEEIGDTAMVQKRIAPFMLALVMCFSLILPVSAADSKAATAKADALYSLGLFMGTDKGYELERAPSRTEALVMLIRVLGKDAAATGCTAKHPFADVPDWADRYVAYGYSQGLTKGVSDTLFGGEDAASSAMYLTFMLRALGYDDGAGDFTWDDPYTLAAAAGMLTGEIDTKTFLRGDVAISSYNALFCVLKDGSSALSVKLIKDGVFTSAQLAKAKAIVQKASLPADEMLDGEALLSSVGKWTLAQYPGAEFYFKADKTGSFTVNGQARAMSWDLGTYSLDGFSGLKVSFADGAVVEYPEFILGSGGFVISLYGDYMGAESYLYRPSAPSSGVSFPVSPMEKKLAGTWKEKDGQRSYTLNADGSGTFSPAAGETSKISWAAFGSSTLYFYLPEALDENGSAAPYAYTSYVSCTDTELTFFVEGSALVYVKQ